MINNTGLILRHRSGADPLADFQYICDDQGRLCALLPLENDEHADWDRIWCQHGLCVDGERIVLSFIKVRMLDTPGLLPVNFEIVGSGLAVGTRSDWRFQRILRSDGDSVLWPAEQPHFATAFLVDPRVGADDYVYLYGTRKGADGVQRCYVARVPIHGMEAVDQYEYLSSPRPHWSRDVSRAMSIFVGMPSELSVSFNRHLDSFLAVHSLDLTGRIVARTAPNPWGPWSEPAVLWTVSTRSQVRPAYPPLIYAGKEHPELSGDNGRKIYLTYIEFEEYFPHLVEVSLT